MPSARGLVVRAVTRWGWLAGVREESLVDRRRRARGLGLTRRSAMRLLALLAVAVRRVARDPQQELLRADRVTRQMKWFHRALFAGHAAMCFGGPYTVTQFVAPCWRAGAGLTQVTRAMYQYDHLDLCGGKTDISLRYLTAGSLRLRRDGFAVNGIRPIDYGIHVRLDVLFTAAEMIESCPDVVGRFVRNLLQGWREAAGPLLKPVDAVMHNARAGDRDLQAAMMQEIIPYVYTGEDQSGRMREDQRWETRAVHAEQGLIAVPIDTLTFHTMTFVEKAHGDAP